MKDESSMSEKMKIAESVVAGMKEKESIEEKLLHLVHALKSVSECVSVTDVHDTILFVNRAFCKTYGYNESELLGNNISMVRSPNNDPEILKEILPATLAGGWQGELFNRRKDGTDFLIALSTSVVRNEQGEMVGLIGVATDISERRQKELTLRESEVRYRKLITTLPDAVFLHQDGRFVFVNPAGIKLLGKANADELIGQPILNVVHPDYRTAVMERVRQAHQEHTPIPTIEEKFLRADGTSVDVEVSAISLTMDGKPTMMVVARDITLQIQSEEKIRRLNRMYSVLTNINQAIVRITEKQALLDAVCKIAIDDGKFGIVYVGSYNRISRKFHVISEKSAADVTFSAGIAEEDLGENDPHNIVVTSEKRFISNDIVNDTRIPERLRQFAGINGLKSVGAFPITTFGKTSGVIGFVAGEANYFNDDETKLLDELATDISFALDNLSKEEDRVKSLQQLHLQSMALQSASNAIVITNKDGIVEWANAAFTTLTGFTLQEAAGKNPRELVKSGMHPDSFYKMMWETILSGKVWRGELINKRKDGTLYSEEQTITPVKDEKGNITHFIGIKLDITERKKIQEALENSESRYRILSHLSSDFSYSCIHMGNGGYKVDWISEAFYNLSEYTEEELLTHSCWMFVLHKGDREEAMKLLRNINIGESNISESRLISKSGKVYWIVNRFECFADSSVPGGKRVYGTVQNITERKELQAQFFRTQRLESLGTLAGGIAHDLNNVLGPIMLAVEFLRRKESDPKALEILSTLESSTRRGKNIVKQILTFARGSADQQQSIIQPRHIITEVEKILHETISKNIEIKTYVPKDLWTVKGDPTHIHQMIMNLAVNARDAMPHGGVLTLSAMNAHLTEKDVMREPDIKPGKFVVIEIKDSGIGIPEELREKIFDPFFTTKEVGKGTGLGLSTVYKLVKSHGGFVAFTSSVGKGTTFKIAIPAVDEEEAKTNVGEVFTPSIKSGLTALVVDDEIDVRSSVSEILRTYNINVIQAENGAEAISMFVQQKDNIDVVITDMMMPVIDGAGVIAAIRKMSPGMKIIMMSGLMSDIQHLSQADKYDLFLQKPFGATELIDAIAKLQK